ncbi:MAG TPA: serine/threonine-protein kinase [Pyrinomonadaceae bacterium]|jgi:serine/threonine-protein kinase|nr:serine/threonine-protein kinase [Pyrinomonadaceae bacterium]
MSRTFDIGCTIGEYRIVDYVGAGGMGEVYRAVHSKLARPAAVKVLTQATQGGGFVERFFNEARIQASLQHPNVATLYDFCEVSGQPCIIMEYVDGQTVAERIAAYRDALPVAEIVYVFEKVVEAIDYIHRHGVIHRDIKSNNIKVGAEGTVKLLDFGIAKGQTSQNLTQAGSVVGTLHYMAPELVRGGAADERADIWSLGVLLYEMATGRVPFDSDTLGDLCDRIGRADYTPPARVNPRLPREVTQIISRCLKCNPAERYRTASDLLADARRLSRAVSQPGPSEAVSHAAGEQAEQVRSSGPSGLALALGGAAVVVVLLVVGAVGLFVFLSQPQAAAEAEAGTVKLLASSSPSPSPHAEERSIEIAVTDGRADVFRGESKLGSTPYTHKARLGERVRLTLRRDGYKDEAVDFTVTEKRAYMFTLSK